MRLQLETVSSVLGLFRTTDFRTQAMRSLDFFQMDICLPDGQSSSTDDLRFLNDLILRILHRGERTLPSLLVERFVAIYGSNWGVKETDSKTCIEWGFSQELPADISDFADFLSPWSGNLDTIRFDPEHPENESRLFRQLLDQYGARIVPCIYTQVPLTDILPTAEGVAFQGQRLDFLITFPNGRGFVLEPGDHHLGDSPEAQRFRDAQRDKALFEHCKIRTLRFENQQIGTPELICDIDHFVKECDGYRYLKAPSDIDSKTLRLGNLLLVPTLVARIQHVLSFFLLHRGMICNDNLRIAIIEQDLECAELAVLDFLDLLHRLSAIYRISLPTPRITLYAIRDGVHSVADMPSLQPELQKYNCDVIYSDDISSDAVDIALDVAIKTNHWTPSRQAPASSFATIRNSFPHSKKHRFHYSSLPRQVCLNEDERGRVLLESFLGDFFRKRELRDGQLPIIRNILLQKPTIGLLPTSAGKSICYQLASLLTPGITFVIDPITFLMKDQVLGLTEQYGITKTIAWHAEAGIIRDEQIGELMATNIIIFLTPERFLRPSFRSAMAGLLAGDLYINYAVIDEAHCVSMWGHDFRPPYLMLERCLRDFCTLRGRAPVVAALTGTASQLVLIDLKRELRIENFESIVRPRSFDRPELTYNVTPCGAGQKMTILQAIFNTVASRLGVLNIRSHAWGVLFANYPKEVWELYSGLANEASAHIIEVAKGRGLEDELPCALACGGMPKNTPVDGDMWKEYKERILPHFKRGRVRLLIGNAAIGVGIDNEYINYVVTYCMPASLESLGQQWGRAGRKRQPSECYLIYSDDQPQVTDRWLNGQIPEMPRRFDDLGAVAYFHAQSFPGEEQDSAGTKETLRKLWRASQGPDGRRLLLEDPLERTQKYLSFLIMMGFVDDYTVAGVGRNTTYHVKMHPVIESSFAGDQSNLHHHLGGSIQAYLSRYRPTTEQEVFQGLASRPEEKLSDKAAGYLINFIYSRIAYQRKESIRTIVNFCREKDLSPDAVRRRMKSFFDRSPKFSDQLDAMAAREIDIMSVCSIIQIIEGYDDVEHLYWETRRLLDERFRADWAAINLYVAIYREKNVSEASIYLLGLMIDELRIRLPMDGQVHFLASFLDCFRFVETGADRGISSQLLTDVFVSLYDRHSMDYLPAVDGLTCSQEIKTEICGAVLNQQIGRVLNVTKNKHSLG